MDAQDLFNFLLGCRSHTGPITRIVVERAVAGDPLAQRQIGTMLFPDEPAEAPSLIRFLTIPSERVKGLLLQIVESWYMQLFRHDEREIAVRLAAEARTKRVIGRSAPNRLLRASAIGVSYLPRRAVTRILLIPSIVCAPSIITIRFGRTRFFFYPLPDEGQDPDDVPAQLVKIHRALADAGRLRILRSLIDTDKTVEHLSRELGQTEQSTRGQLIVLRDAGLVTLRMDERRMSFEIRENLPSVVFRALQKYLPESNRFLGVTQAQPPG